MEARKAKAEEETEVSPPDDSLCQTMEGKKKKASGAERRKRQKLEAEEAKKSSKFFMPFFIKPGTSTSACSPEEPAASLLESSQVNIQFEKESTTENVDMTEGKDSNSESVPEEMDIGKDSNSESVPEDIEPNEADSVKQPQAGIPEVIQQHDIGLLKFDKDSGKAILTDALKTELIKLGSKYFQNSEGPFLPTKGRSMSKSWYKRKLGDGRGKEVTRSWLLYSPSKRSAFCFCCLLFSRSDGQSTLERERGFNQWRIPNRISVHENAKNHRDCFTQWKERERNLAENRGVIDMALQSQIEKERQKWRAVLTRILDCIKYLVNHNLALGGHRESLELADVSNVGNFLDLVKLLAVYDPIMKEHLMHVESHPGAVSYLSPHIQNELIQLMASTVRQSLLRGICKAKYYGIMFDSTPDLAHRDQMSEVVRYVDIDFEKNTVCVRESFLGFIQVRQKDAGSLVESILKQLEKDGMKLQDCRLQCYDNAPVMAGHKSGVCQRICEKNKLALFVNCDNHSLNLVGVHATMQDPLMGSFFGAIDALYVFFSSSPGRWQKLKNALPVVLKSQSETRWSAKAEAVKPISKYIDEILTVLHETTDNENETAITRSDARVLCSRMLSYDFLTLLEFWNIVLGRIDLVQKRLQDPQMNFHDAALDLKSLRDNLLEQREVLVSESLEKGFGLCQEWNVEVERHVKKKMADEKLRDAGLTAKQEMERVMKSALDRLHREMDERFTRLHDIDIKFGFLLNIKELCYSAEINDLKKKCVNFAESYSSDIAGQQLYEEILDCRMLLSRRENIKIAKPEELLKFIVQYGDESVFPNLRVAIRLLLTIAVSMASCERSFSKLKLILSYLRASMTQDRLCDLTLLSVEREEIEKTDFNNIIDQFASMKARTIML